MSELKIGFFTKLKGCLRLILKLIYNIFRRPRAFFNYLTAKKVLSVFKFGLEKGFKSAEHWLNDLLSGLEDGAEIFSFAGEGKSLHIIAPGHCIFLTKLMSAELRKLGISYDIQLKTRGYLDIPESRREDPYIIICPQLYSGLPKHFIAMQMEQSLSKRWSEDTDYLRTLKSAHTVLDYSLSNIEHFSNREDFGGKLFYYLPVDYLSDVAPDSCAEEKEIDVLFYGDDSAERRAEILKQLKPLFKIKIVNNLFGADMLKLIRKSKIVLNIHFYDVVLLETTRIYEVLSQNSSIIISEKSADSFEDSRLEGIVDFVDIGDIEAIKDRISYWLSHEDERRDRLKANNEKLKSKKSDFSYFFMRALLANEIIDFETFYKHQKYYFSFEGERVCLGLPETVERSRTFMNDTHGFKLFPGLRHRLGWIGCGLSYKFLLRKAFDENLKRIIICEDDCFFPPDFEERFGKVLRYLSEHEGELDLFSGLISDSSDINLLDAFEYEGEQFFIPDKTVGMVLNIYMNSCFAGVLDWDLKNRDITKNTIDRYLQNKPLRILSMLPFPVGQADELNSCIWGFSNLKYKELISESSEYFGRMIEEKSGEV